MNQLSVTDIFLLAMAVIAMCYQLSTDFKKEN
jgi:hypothetical protein